MGDGCFIDTARSVPVSLSWWSSPSSSYHHHHSPIPSLPLFCPLSLVSPLCMVASFVFLCCCFIHPSLWLLYLHLFVPTLFSTQRGRLTMLRLLLILFILHSMWLHLFVAALFPFLYRCYFPHSLWLHYSVRFVAALFVSFCGCPTYSVFVTALSVSLCGCPIYSIFVAALSVSLCGCPVYSIFVAALSVSLCGHFIVCLLLLYLCHFVATLFSLCSFFIRPSFWLLYSPLISHYACFMLLLIKAALFVSLCDCFILYSVWLPYLHVFVAALFPCLVSQTLWLFYSIGSWFICIDSCCCFCCHCGCFFVWIESWPLASMLKVRLNWLYITDAWGVG